jgi:histidinol-phosphate phosphatase family protein
VTALPRQCAVLVGGAGTRLGSLTAAIPKPLLACGDRPFLAWILRELSRFGIEEFILLASNRSDQMAAFATGLAHYLPKLANVKLSHEPMPAGTGGALWHAKHLFDDRFLVVNGDSWCDTNLARFIAPAASTSHILGHVLLTQVMDASRYGVVKLIGQQIVALQEKPPAQTAGVINGGIYVLHKDVLNFVEPVCSLEKDVLPQLAKKGLLTGQLVDGYFIDIGIPHDYAQASIELPRRLHRPAVFLGRDGVLNNDLGRVGTTERFRWTDGAKDAVRAITDSGFHAFIVTNQVGIAHGHYKEQDIAALYRWMIGEIRVNGGTIDDLRCSPTHPEAIVPRYHGISNYRRPEPRMIIDLAHKWEVDLTRSFCVGAKKTDLQAAEKASIPGYHFSRGNLHTFVTRLLTNV